MAAYTFNMATPKLASDAKVIRGSYDRYKDWHMDPAGYFLIRPNTKTGLIECGLCQKNNVVELLITGKDAMEICWTLVNQGITFLPEHLAYVAKEVQNAKIALERGLAYVQDSELDFSKKDASR